MSQSLLVGIFFFGVVFLYLRSRRFAGRLPPGPKGVSILGNAFDLPTEEQWLTFAKWKKTYGDLVGLRVLGQPIVLINSFELANELLTKRGAYYSDRPGFSLIQEWGGWDWMLTPMRYGQDSIGQRKFLNRYLSASAVKDHEHLLETEAIKFVQRLSETPKDFQNHTRLFACATIMMITYGHKVHDKHDQLIVLAEAANQSLEILKNVGAHPVDLFPWRNGSKFVAQMAQMRHLSERLIKEPYDQVRKELAEGVAYPSMASWLLETNTNPDGTIANERLIQGTTAGAYVAGADTIVSSLDTAILGLMINPDVQKKAQAELDGVLRGQRMPTFADRPHMPYLEAIVLETMRWGPVAPLAVPHRLMKDDSFNGYFFPANTTFIANSWGFLNDPEMFPNPSQFNPDRFINKNNEIRTDLLDAKLVAFGYGRRICPGRFLGDSAVWIGVATMLATFELSKPLDQNGKPIEPDLTWVSALICHPKPYK
ncbi:cytochrome P450 [Pluteus cervinus]|uniref:Cytochrome P450 n=1 Tax=Pluteus cervinus TaxID=181527 RepID=A0ACD3AR14_9AGAR|nr:cytochrome P450 [Pluteus cervinus]